MLRNYVQKRQWRRYLLGGIAFFLLTITPVASDLSPENLQACKDAMEDVDVDGDSRINKAEYLNLVIDLSPYPGCPDIGQVELFLGSGIFNVVFKGLSCLCRRYEEGEDAATCCTAPENTFLSRTYPDEYTERVCSKLLETLEYECGSGTLPELGDPEEQPPADTPADSPIDETPADEQGGMPSAEEEGMSSTEVDDRSIVFASSSDGGDDGGNNSLAAKIVVPILVLFFIGLFAYFLIRGTNNKREAAEEVAPVSLAKGTLNGNNIELEEDPTDKTEDDDPASPPSPQRSLNSILDSINASTIEEETPSASMASSSMEIYVDEHPDEESENTSEALPESRLSPILGLHEEEGAVIALTVEDGDPVSTTEEPVQISKESEEEAFRLVQSLGGMFNV